MMTTRQILFAAVAALTMSAVPLAAQFTVPTDLSSQNGGSASFSSAIANFAPSGYNFSFTVNQITRDGRRATVSNPAGEPVEISRELASEVGNLVMGAIDPARVAIVEAAFGGTPAAAALVRAVASLGAARSAATPTQVANAINAYNAAVDALPAGQTPGPGLLMMRQLLAPFTR